MQFTEKANELVQAIDTIATELKTKIEDGALEKAVKDALYNEQGIDGLNNENLIRERMVDLRNALKAEAADKVQHAINSHKHYYETLVNESERKLVRIKSGISIAERYAKTHGLSLQEAQDELNAYARVKTGGFEGTLSDRYAAIVNYNIIEEKHIGYSYIKDEIKEQNMAATEAALEKFRQYFGHYPQDILKRYEKTGYIVAKALGY